MSTEPEQILAEINALLADLPDTAEDAAELNVDDLNALAARLEEAHEVLVRALEAVDRGPASGTAGMDR